MEKLPNQKTIAVLGSGPKAAALHVKSYLLSLLRRKSIHVVSWEMNEVASNWDGSNGFTDGDCKLGTSPLKDVTYPGTFGVDHEMDMELSKFSWVSFLRCDGKLDSWVDRGCPPCTHKEWSMYIKWVLLQCKADIRKGQIIKAEPAGSKIRLHIDDGTTHIYDGFVYTGPGIPLSPKCHGEICNQLLDSKTFWTEKFKVNGKVAVIGTGESSAAIAQYLLKVENVDIDIVTRSGYLGVRDEGFSINQFFSRPQKWLEYPEEVRREIIRRGDRGVLSPAFHDDLKALGNDLGEIFGTVEEIDCKKGKLLLKLKSSSGMFTKEYDYVVSAIGFDVFSHVKSLLSDNFVLPDNHREVVEGMTTSLCLPIETHKIHVPGLAKLAQGPGFANLSSLFCTASRIISEYI